MPSARLSRSPVGKLLAESALVAKMTQQQKTEYGQHHQHYHDVTSLLFDSNKKHAAEMAAVSPNGHLAGLHVPVYLLHGREDNLIPFAEAEWLAQDLPRGTLQEMLVSPLIAHVGTTTAKPGIWNEWKLLHLLANVMERARRG